MTRVWQQPFRVYVCFCATLIFQAAAVPQQNLSSGVAPASQTAAANTSSVSLFYTSKLLGYFRIPDWQHPVPADPNKPRDVNDDCGKGADGEQSPSVAEFDEAFKRAQGDVGGVKLPILVGTGDNFSPEIEGREFCKPPVARSRRYGKEFYFWNGTEWVNNESPGLPRMWHGQGTIPEDNVAKFLTSKGYSAIVPGRHDFYFGPERLRELARLLATTEIRNNNTMHPFGVQMLGANVVIETNWSKDHERLTDKDAPPWFIPRFPKASDLGEIGGEVSLVDFPGGGTAYPWYRGPKLSFKLKDAKDKSQLQPANSDADVQKKFLEALKAAGPVTKLAELRKAIAGIPEQAKPPGIDKLLDWLENTTIRLCDAGMNTGGADLLEFDRHDIMDKDKACEAVYPTPAFDTDAQKLEFDLLFPWKNDLPPADDGRPQSTHTYTLNAGGNYRLCFTPKMAKVHDRDKGNTFCVRVSVYQPFFQFPWGHSNTACAYNNCNQLRPAHHYGDPDPWDYRDPDPYVLLTQEADHGVKTDVAIFGVVDPSLTDYIGVLNYTWTTTDEIERPQSQYKTVTAIKDPADALKQLLGYFERRRKEDIDDHKIQNNKLVRVLLAEMSPQKAQKLAAQMAGARPAIRFQIVVTAADEQLATEGTIEITGKSEASRLIAVPPPYYRVSTKKWIADVGTATMHATGNTEEWQIVSSHNQPSGPSAFDELSTRNQPTLKPFWDTVDSEIRKECLPGHFNGETDQVTEIQFLTLCLMQKDTGADLALLQKRDFFTALPFDPSRLPASLTSDQQILDRIVWKGDFEQLIYVPGSALKKAFELSNAFDADDESNLSLADEKGRGLLKLGVIFNPDTKEYLINGLALDANRLYSVVTSDYISAGDTGYPDLGTAQLDPPLRPTDFGKKLTTISSVVCRRLDPKGECLDQIIAEDHFDEFSQRPVLPGKGKTDLKRLEMWTFFHGPHNVPGAPKDPIGNTIADAAQIMVEQRRISDFKLSKWSIGYNALHHNGSDFDVQNNFAGITTPGVNALHFTKITSDLLAQMSWSWLHHQIALSPSYSFNTERTGVADDFDKINQIANLGAFDISYAYSWKNGRAPEHYDWVLTSHFETPLTRPFNTFDLATKHPGPHPQEQITDHLRFELDRNYTELIRPGIRWKKRVSSIEMGPEWGHEWNAVQQIDFFTNGVLTVPCTATATLTIGQCIKKALNTDPNAITPNSSVGTHRIGQDHAGAYWNLNLTVPFHSRFSYVLTDKADWFFVKYQSEPSTATLFRDVEQHQLKFIIFPSFSIGPEVDVLMFQNKSVPGLKGHFLAQEQFIVKAQFAFELANWRKKWTQIKYAPPSGSN